MKLAVDEMYASRSEHHDRFDPMVGAVIVDQEGNELGRTHRASLREGDHAEFTLLERLLPHKNLEGCTLYATLEPCTSRQPPKMPCAERIVSARVGKVFIGMPDPNPKIQGRGITYLLAHGVEVDFFDLDLFREIQGANKAFLEQYDQAFEITSEPREFEGPSDKEKEPIFTAGLDDLSLEAIREYVTARNQNYDIPSPALWAFLHKNGFLTTSEPRGSLVPTLAGLLLFGKAPEDFLVQSKVKAEARRGEEVIAEDITGPLLSVPESVTRFLIANMGTYTRIEGFKRVEVPEYPVEALREAVVNAVAHRDYREGTRVIIQILKDRIVLKSPGHLIRPLSLKTIRTYNAPPYSRNPRIAETFSYVKLMEERGWGIRAMRDILVRHGLPPPQFDYDDGYFVVTFYGRKRAVIEVQIASEILAQLNSRQKKLLELLVKQGRITSADCVREFQITRDTANRDFSRLMNLGVIEKRGSGRGTHYVLIGTE